MEVSSQFGVGTNWFSSRVRRRVGNGRNICFWKDKWLGEEPFLTLFPRLYSLSTQKEAKVGDMMVYQGGLRVWNTTWRRHPFLWEVNLIDNLMALLEGVILGPEVDRWEWIPDESGVFLVKSAYTVLELISILVDDLCPLEEGFFSLIWKSPAPSKVVAFSWSLLLDRIPTRSNLAICNILPPDSSLLCVFCERRVETPTRFFLHCEVTSRIWRGVLNWIEFNFITPPNLFLHFECWNSEATSKRLKKGAWLIWHTTIWLIWKERNERIFNNHRKDVEEIVDEIKAVTWFWALSRLRIASFLFYEWTWNPRECLNRR